MWWKKFNFYSVSEIADHSVPQGILCHASGGSNIFFGCDDGMIHVLDSSLRVFKAFIAYQKGVSALFPLSGDVLAALGSDDPSHPLKACSLKCWDLPAIPDNPMVAPAATVDLFPRRGAALSRERLPDATVTAAALAPTSARAAPPPGPADASRQHPLASATLLAALSDGTVRVMQGDLRSSARTVRSTLDLKRQIGTAGNAEGTAPEQVASAHSVLATPRGAFLVSSSHVLFLTLPDMRVATLDAPGCAPGLCCLGPDGSLVVARDEALQIYTEEGRGPCLALPVQKSRIAWAGEALLVSWAPPPVSESVAGVTAPPPQPSWSLHDLRHKLTVCTVEGAAAEHAFAIGGAGDCVVVDGARRAWRVCQKPLRDRMALMLRKHMYEAAVELAIESQASNDTLADIRHQWASHLYAQGEHALAVEQFKATVGHVQPSSVIRLFLGLEEMPNLVVYLEHLHDRGLATREHTTLLLNCYSHLGDEGKLGQFICGDADMAKALWWLSMNTPPEVRSEPRLAHEFHADTAVGVLRQTRYFHHALFVASAVERHDLVLQILTRDLKRWEDAIRFIKALPLDQALAAVADCGDMLMDGAPDQTTDMVVSLCIQSLTAQSQPQLQSHSQRQSHPSHPHTTAAATATTHPSQRHPTDTTKRPAGPAPTPALRPGQRAPPRKPTDFLDLFIGRNRAYPSQCVAFCRQLLRQGLVRRDAEQTAGLVLELVTELLFQWAEVRRGREEGRGGEGGVGGVVGDEVGGERGVEREGEREHKGDYKGDKGGHGVRGKGRKKERGKGGGGGRGGDGDGVGERSNGVGGGAKGGVKKASAGGVDGEGERGGGGEGSAGAENGKRGAGAGDSASAGGNGVASGNGGAVDWDSEERSASDAVMEVLRDFWPPGHSPSYDPEEMLLLCRVTHYLRGLVFLFERQGLLRHALLVGIETGDPSAVIAMATRLCSPNAGGDAELWGDVLMWLASRGQSAEPDIRASLAHVQGQGMGRGLHPTRVLECLQKGDGIRVVAVKDYLARHLNLRCRCILEDCAATERLLDEAASTRRHTHRLRVDPLVFDSARCDATGQPLELPTVHFRCGHSFNASALGEEEECPLCSSRHRTLAQIRAAMRPTPVLEERLAREREGAEDAAEVSAEYIGAGALGSVWGVLSRDHGDESREERETLVAVMAARLGGVDLALEYLGSARAGEDLFGRDDPTLDVLAAEDMVMPTPREV